MSSLLIREVYQQFDSSKPISTDEPRYVSCDSQRGSVNLLSGLVNRIRLADTPQHLLFTGTRGSGKSTELLHLARRLEAEKFFVVYFAVDEDIDLNDVDYSDLVFALLHQIDLALVREGILDISLSRRLQNYFDTSFSEYTTAASVNRKSEYTLPDLITTIKNSPTTRIRLREVFAAHPFSLITTANELLLEATTRLRQQGFQDLVVIVDNLDRMALRDIPDSSHNTHERLFIQHGSLLTQLQCHILYTIPTSMVFSTEVSALTTTFGISPCVLSPIRIADRADKVSKEGLIVLQKIVHRRLEAVGTTAEAVFDVPATLAYLCRMSGGLLRSLFSLIQDSCLVHGEIPITRANAEDAVRNVRNEYERLLRPTHFDVLAQIERTHTLPGSEQDQFLLNSRCVLEYQDTSLWYAVHPIVRQMERFQNLLYELEFS